MLNVQCKSRLRIVSAAVAVIFAVCGRIAGAGFPGFLASDDPNGRFRVESRKVPGGAELVTIFARREPSKTEAGPVEDLPLVSILRDTLGDDIPENDRLRYVWMLTYTRPGTAQNIAAAVPFMYTRAGNKKDVGTAPPPAIIDLQTSDKEMWRRIFWSVLGKILSRGVGHGAGSGLLQYRQNAEDYRRAAFAEALTVLALYQETTGEQVLSRQEQIDIQARLMLREKFFGWHMAPENLERVYDKETTTLREIRGQNWELLRQHAEGQDLYFDPVEMSDGEARHALLWVRADDLKKNAGRKWDRRFLNIRSPWDDKELLDWKGYRETRWFDAEEREVVAGTPNSTPRTLIPLALFGLDHPKVPMILVDFRDRGNPKMREVSKRILKDLTGNVLSISQFSGLPFTVGKFVYDFVTGRRGLDLNQASRVRTYSQMKVMLMLDDTLDPYLKDELTKRVELVSLNPMQNDLGVEARLASAQYKNLIDWAARPDGLAKKLDEDRREEMNRLRHSGFSRSLLTLAHFASFKTYKHREKASDEMYAAMDMRRRLDFHERFLRETAYWSADPEVDSDLPALRRSMVFVAQRGEPAGEKTSRALAKLFAMVRDGELRDLCVAGLYRINNSAAKKELLAIYKDQRLPDRWRNMSANYLRLAAKEGQRISKRDLTSISAIEAN